MIALVSENEPFRQTSCEQKGQQWTMELFCSFIFQFQQTCNTFPQTAGAELFSKRARWGDPCRQCGPTCASGRDDIATNKKRAADGMANVGLVRLA